MTCQHCNAALPPFALFCGECGRSVSAPVVAPPVVERPIAPVTEPTTDVPSAVQAPDVLFAGVSPAPVSPAPVSPAESAPVLCPVCGARGELNDRYCAECGRPMPADTQIIERIPPAGNAVSGASPRAPERAEVFEPKLVLTPHPAPTADVESTRIVPRGTGGARFVLQFSTGESYTVLGSGLAGRNPHPEPGEYVDHLVTVMDPGRSVSKTHFEFGQHEGVFWFSDRHSGNGSTIREPGSEARICEPGRRYPIVRGTRVDIGEQFVVVS